MRLRHAAFAASLLALASATPAMAGQPGGWVAPDGRVYQGMYDAPAYDEREYDDRIEEAPDYDDDYDRRYADYERARDAWFEDCVRRGGPSGLAGAALGGIVGGVAGNRIAGRGNRTVGTIIGAGVGAVAGAAIERGAARDRIREECRAALDGAGYDYAAGPPPLPAPMGGHAQAGSGHAMAMPAHPMPHPVPRHGKPYPHGCAMPACGYPMMAMPMMMMPVMYYPAAKPECKETVTEIVEYVTVPARRAAPRRVIRDKRIRVVPDKRIRK